MIGFLRGKVAALLTDYCLLDVNGVGYRIYITGTTRSKLRQGEKAMIFTHMSVREDAIQLYGFASQEEYDLFQLLITVSGIGPKVAMGALSASTPQKLCQAISLKQISVLTKLPGIGKKSAERLVLELKDKVSIGGIDDEEFSGEEGTLFNPASKLDDNMFADAAQALMGYGYTQSEIEKMFIKAKKNKSLKDTGALIMFALREFGKG